MPALRAMACARRSEEGCVSHFSLHLLQWSGIMFKLESLKRAEIAERGSPLTSTAPASAAYSNRRDPKSGKNVTISRMREESRTGESTPEGAAITTIKNAASIRAARAGAVVPLG